MIYFLRAVDDTGLIKIGYTGNDPHQRLAKIQWLSPIRLKIIRVIEGGKDREAELHLHFALFRSHGDWFKPIPELLEYISNPDGVLPIISMNQAIKPEISTCQAINLQGKPCVRPIYQGIYCWNHRRCGSPIRAMSKRCTGQRTNGEPCRARVSTLSDTLCHHHLTQTIPASAALLVT